VVAQDLVQQREQVLARDLARRADRHLPLDAGIDGVADAERRREAVDHFADVGTLEVEDHRLFFTQRLIALSLRRGASWRRVLLVRYRWVDAEPERDHRHDPSTLHSTLLSGTRLHGRMPTSSSSMLLAAETPALLPFFQLFQL